MKESIKRISVFKIENDYQGRPRLQNIETKHIYADISFGEAGYNPLRYEKFVGDWNKLNIPGDWHTTSSDGEPSAPIRKGVFFKIKGVK